MAKVTHTNHVKMTVWTPEMRVDMSGTRLGCAIELFGTLDVEQMKKALEKMQEHMGQRQKWEDEHK